MRATLEDIRKHGHVPCHYVGAEAAQDDGEPFEEKMKRLTATLREQQAEGAKLDAAIAATSSRIQAECLRVLSANAALTPGNRTLAADTQKREFPECR